MYPKLPPQAQAFYNQAVAEAAVTGVPDELRGEVASDGVRDSRPL